MRGGLRRMGESCLVNAIVVQAWEAAHEQRRDLVIGTTGPDRFHAHAWLQGDPLPLADDPGFDASLASPSRGGGPEEAGPGPSQGAETGADRSVRTFTELLRRPAPDYPRIESTRAR